jgi:hypothetical protein
MMLNELETLIFKRKQWVQSSKENNFNFDSILSGIYNDPSHFIYEILQNAEDARATEISFSLYEDRLVIDHDGKDFNFNNVDGITGIGISTKRNELNAIGKFGVGFKSVFAITQTPYIHSGKFHFKIIDFVVPVVTEDDGCVNTKFILPFDHPQRTTKEVFEIVYNKIGCLGLTTLLFLENIHEIKWKTPDKSGHYYKQNKYLSVPTSYNKVTIISKIGQEEINEEYIVINRPILIEGHQLKVEVAYKVEENESRNRTIVKTKNSNLVVYFPTEKVTYLNFIIQGPYKTTPNRETIPLDEEQNRNIINETAQLVADSITTIKEICLLNISFLEVLPIDHEHTGEIIYSVIFEKVKEKLKSKEAFLPNIEGAFTSANEAILARGKEISEILNSEDIEILFGKKQWLNTDIASDKAKLLHRYIINELKVKYVDFEDFIQNLSEKFLQNKSDDWLIDLYGRLLDKRSLYIKNRTITNMIPKLWDKPIIRLEDNSHLSPYDKNNKIQVYFPSKNISRYGFNTTRYLLRN